MISNDTLADLAESGWQASIGHVEEMARELLVLRKAFSGKPDAYVIAGSRMYKDRSAATIGIAESILKDRGDDGSRIEGLYRKPPTE